VTNGDDSSNPNEPWPWDQAPNVAAVTVRAVVEGAPILVVSHDADDDGWQFLDGRDVDTDEARLIAMRRVLHLDPSLREVADLPPGWMARRHRVGGAWWRGPNPRADGQ
jgi:hypothetical protein